ncbi:MAG TPA: DUF4097 family beta strand repeat-containing protein [Chthonomonadaceae bacterium]|nr:DUF4097 family beta strand repeat-containing protein [Chthonomonadaceae bacterium]
MSILRKRLPLALLSLLSILVLSCRSERTRFAISSGADSGPSERSTEQLTLNRQNAGSLEVSTPNGDIHVLPGDGEKIEIQATKEVHADSVEAAKAFLKQIKIVTQQENGRWIVKADWPQPTPDNVHSVSVSLEVHAPASMHLTAQSENGSLNASGMADAHLQTENGSIQADHISGVLDAHSSNGSIETEDCADVPQAETQNGQITLRGVQHLGSVKTENGSITIEMAQKQDTAPVEITSDNGTIHLHLPANASAHLDAGVMMGSIDMQPSTSAHFTNEAHTQMTADLGSGKGTVRLHTNMGSIDIHAE